MAALARHLRVMALSATLILAGCSDASEGGAETGSADVEASSGGGAFAEDATSDIAVNDADGDEALACILTGCNGDICASEEVITTCEAGPPSNLCLQLASCGVRDDGTCGWTYTDAYEACVAGLDGGAPDALDAPDQSSEGPSDASAEDASQSGPLSDVNDDAMDPDDSTSDLDDAGASDTSESADAEAMNDTETTTDADGSADDLGGIGDASEEDIEEGPQTLIDEIVPITEASQYDKGELYGMGVDPEGRVSIFWRAERADGLHDLVVSQSDPQVSAFAAPVALVEGVAPLGITAGGGMEMDGPNHLLTWRDDPEAGVSRIMFRRAEMPTLEGEDQILSESNTHTLYRPHVTWRAPSTARVLWQKSGSNDQSDVMLRCSADGGVTFGEERMVNPSEVTASVSDAVFASSGALFVAYHAKPSPSAPVRIYVTSSDDLGVTWSAPLDMSTLGGADEGFDPTLVRGMDGVLHLAWYNNLPGIEGQAWISHSEDGVIWSEPELLPTIQSQVGLRPGRGSVLHASGEDAKFGYGCILNPPPDCGIKVMSSYDAGQSWGAPSPLPVTAETTLLGHDMVANLIEGYLHIAWWETLPEQMTKMQLKFITLEE